MPGLGAGLGVLVAAGALLAPGAFPAGVFPAGAAPAGAVELSANEGWIMGPTSIPDPTVDGYLQLVQANYLQPQPSLFAGQPTFPDYPFAGLTTPSQFCPFVCLPPPNPQLTFAESVAAGTQILHGELAPQLAAGDQVAVFGYSQSATVSSQVMTDLLADPPGAGYRPENLAFVLIGDPNNPLGGMLTRFPAYPVLTDQPIHLPLLGIPLSIGPTPTSGFDTAIYTGDYDGFANFPQDVLNATAVLNAIAGVATVHFNYLDFTNLADTVTLGEIGDTDFFAIPQQLPLLWPIYQLGDFGRVLGDALAPGLKLVIDWGYGNPGDPSAGFSLDGADPIGVAGPWAVTAAGQLADGDGVAGFGARLDPLQMLAGIQYAGVHSFVAPVNDLLGLAGHPPLDDSVVQLLLSGYTLINAVDTFVLTEWQQLATSLQVADWLGPAVVFNGEPLISMAPLLESSAVFLEILNLLGA